MGSSSCSCTCPFKKCETEATEEKIQKSSSIKKKKKQILKYIKESLKYGNILCNFQLYQVKCTA